MFSKLKQMLDNVMKNKIVLLIEHESRIYNLECKIEDLEYELRRVINLIKAKDKK
jgi:hypothetical protein